MGPWTIGASAIQGATGLAQILAGAFKKVKRPDAVVNKNIKEAADMASTRLKGRMTGAGAAETNVRKSGANTLASVFKSSRNPNATIAGALSVNEGQNKAGVNLATAEANDFNQRFQQYTMNKARLAAEENRVWDWNERQKYVEKGSTKSALISSGIRNTMGATTAIAQSEIASEYNDMLMKIYGKQ